METLLPVASTEPKGQAWAGFLRIGDHEFAFHIDVPADGNLVHARFVKEKEKKRREAVAAP